MFLLFVFFLIILIPIALGGRIIGLFINRFSKGGQQRAYNDRRRQQEQARKHKEKVDIEEIGLHKFDKDQGEYIDFEEEKK